MHLRTLCGTQPKQYPLNSKLPCFLAKRRGVLTSVNIASAESHTACVNVFSLTPNKKERMEEQKNYDLLQRKVSQCIRQEK